MRLFYIAFISIFTLFSYGQENTPYQDSLLYQLEHADEDSTQYNALMRLARSHVRENSDKELGYLLQALQIANRSLQDLNVAQTLFRIAQYHFRLGDLDESLHQHRLALESFELKLDPILYIQINNGLATTYRKKGFYSKSISTAFESIKLSDKYDYEEGKTSAFNNIAIIFNEQGKFHQALAYFQKVKEIFEESGNIAQMARMSANMAIIYKNLGEYEKSFELFDETLSFFKKQKNEQALSVIYQNFGVLYQFTGNKDSAMFYIKMAHELAEKQSQSYMYAETGIALANIYVGQNLSAEAEEFISKVKPIIEDNNFRILQPRLYLTQANIENRKKNYKGAMELYVKSYELNDSIRDETHKSAFTELQSNYEAEQKEIQIEQLQQEKELETAKVSEQQAVIDKQNTQRFAFIGGIGLLLLFGVYMLFNIRQKRKANTLLTQQKNEIQEKNKEITDSITYAKRIQDAVLPSDELIHSQLPDSFVFYLPKDIVSGDFYWVEPVPNAVLFATVDCTGHGVPGGFMSMLGHNALHKAVSESSIDKPSKVLDYLHQSVVDSLQNNNNEVRDGMDVAICALVEKDQGKKELEFAGAMNPIYIISNGELKEIKGDKMAIGSDYKDKPFTNHSVEVNKGDMVYIFSDGYPDQFGGENGKKYKYANFKKLFLSICKEPINMQREKLAKEFYKWKGDYEQVDDILVMGVKV